MREGGREGEVGGSVPIERCCLHTVLPASIRFILGVLFNLFEFVSVMCSHLSSPVCSCLLIPSSHVFISAASPPHQREVPSGDCRAQQVREPEADDHSQVGQLRALLQPPPPVHKVPLHNAG